MDNNSAADPKYVIRFGIAPRILLFKLLYKEKLTVRDMIKLVRRNLKFVSRMSVHNDHFSLLKDNEQIQVDKFYIVKIY